MKSVADKVDNYITRIFPESLSVDDLKPLLKDANENLDLETLQETLNRPIRNFVLGGGKKIRAQLFWSILGEFNSQKAVFLPIAAFIELVHNGTLVLDDIEDNAQLRRGKPTTHSEFGLDIAVNVGATLHLAPLNLLLSSIKSFSNEEKVRLFEIYVEELTNVSFGQALDIGWGKGNLKVLTDKQYFEMVKLKTGALIRMSARMASVVANQNDYVEQKLGKFSENVGIAYQIIDDILDLSPENSKFGKSRGKDITEGKMSLPVIEALQNLPSQSRERLRIILKSHTTNKKTIEEAITLISKSGGIDKAKAFAQALVNDSLNILHDKLGIKEGSDLDSLAQFMLERTY